MSSIQEVVSKYVKIQQKNRQQKESISEIIYKVTNIHITHQDIEIQNKNICLHISSIKKNIILGYSDKILQELHKIEQYKEIQKLR
ncbi:MAG: hypothetical protein RI996_375 [Candidatus Parcubacteria bacterium]|jgi:hypothetical protein